MSAAFEEGERDWEPGLEDLTAEQIARIAQDHAFACECEICQAALPDEFRLCITCEVSRHRDNLTPVYCQDGADAELMCKWCLKGRAP